MADFDAPDGSSTGNETPTTGTVVKPYDVACWHLTEVPFAPTRVRYRALSRHSEVGLGCRSLTRSGHWFGEIRMTHIGCKALSFARIGHRWQAIQLTTSLKTRHGVIQAATPFEDCHLFRFDVGDKRYGIPNQEWDVQRVLGPTNA